jgi:hypothetical protein
VHLVGDETLNIQRIFRTHNNMYRILWLPFAISRFYRNSQVMESAYVIICLNFATHGLVFFKRKIYNWGTPRVLMPLPSNYTWHLATLWWRNLPCSTFKEPPHTLPTADLVFFTLWPISFVPHKLFLPSEYGCLTCQHQNKFHIFDTVHLRHIKLSFRPTDAH